MLDSSLARVLHPVPSASPGCPLRAKRPGSIAAAAAAAFGEADPPCFARISLFSPCTSPRMRLAVAGEASRLSCCAADSFYPSTLRNAVEDNSGAALSNAESYTLDAALKGAAAASAMAADSSPYASTFSRRLSKRGCCAKRVRSSASFLDAFQHALDEAAAQARLERAGRDDAERQLEQMQEDMREKRREASVLQQQVSSLQRRCDTLVAQQKQQAEEVALLRQQQTAKRVETSLLREEVHDNSRKTETLLSQLDEAQQQLCVSRATLTRREMENEALVQQLASHRDKCAAFEEEIARLAKQMQADKEVTSRLKEQLHVLFHAESAAGAGEAPCFDDIHSENRLRICGLQRQAAAERAVVVELLLKKKNMKLALKAQGLQDKLEACEIKEAKNKTVIVRLQEALDVERLKSSEALQREMVLHQQLAEQQQQQQQQHEQALLHLKQEEALMSLSKKLGQADVEAGRLQAEIRKKDALVTKLTEQEAQLQQQLCEGTRTVEQQKTMNNRQEEEILRLRDKIEEKTRCLRQQQLEQEARRVSHGQEMQQVTNRLQESSALLCEAKREALAKEEQFQLLLQEVQQLRDVRAASDALQERCETSSRLLGIYKKENQQHERKCEALVKEVQLLNKRVCMLQEELDSKAKCLREAQDAEEAIRLTLQQAQEGRSVAEERVSYLEREKEELLLNWERQWECQQQHVGTLQAQQRQQFEEELKLLKEEVEQRRLQHQEEMTVLEKRLSEQTKKELMLQTELDQKVAQVRRLRASLDELEARAELLRGEKRAREEAEKQLQLERQKCRLQEKDKSQLSGRCELLENEVQRLNRAVLEAAETTHRCEELQQEKLHLQETLQEVERDSRVKDAEISTLTHNQREMQKQMQDERADIETVVPKLIEMQVKNKVLALQRKFQQKMTKLKRKLADRSQYEDRVREVMQAELQSLQRWNQEMEKWELLTSANEAKPCILSTSGCPAELLCCHK